MRCKRRYLSTLIATVILLFIGYVGFKGPSSSNLHQRLHRRAVPQVQPFLDHGEYGADMDMHPSVHQRRQSLSQTNNNEECRMETCFDFSKCKEFKVYVYPIQEKVSTKYREILAAMQRSQYYTDDPTKACIFIPSLDTLDRDKLSKDNYVVNLDHKIENLPYWNGGRNHIIFNIYFGTWPNYDESDLGFNPGKAILAKASMSEEFYRSGFDISFPLFHKEHAFSGGEPGFLAINNVPPVREYTLVFKGKRYLTGIGSETRNSLYHIHNDKDIILLTTCKHGKGWENVVDERCEKDNEDYDKYDYKVMLHKSTYCLVPRGRRLGSYRFLEALQAACVPVLLSNGWVLPFSDVIDWNKAVVWGDERLLLQIPSVVRSLSHADILALRQQTQFLWETYFSSIEKMVHTTLEIMKDRVDKHLVRTAFVWNTPPGALAVRPEFSDSLLDFPYFYRHLGTEPGTRFTAVVYVTNPNVMLSSPLYRLMKSLTKSKALDKVLLLWHTDSPIPTDIRWPVPSTLPIVNKHITSIDARFLPYPEIRTDAVLSVDQDQVLLTDEVDFAFHVWCNFPERLIGYEARSHYWDDGAGRWLYSSRWTNDYSMVLTSSAFYHRYYGYLFSHWLSPALRQVVSRADNCEDILMNFLVSHVSRQPPLKLGQRRGVPPPPPPPPVLGGVPIDDPVAEPGRSPWQTPEHFVDRQHCVGLFANHFGYLPLLRTGLRLDPLLFRDRVSRTRKKYRQMEP